MTNKIAILPQPIKPLTPKTAEFQNKAEVSGKGFKQVLQSQVNTELKFSNHAQERLKSRNIELSEDDISKLTDAVGKARDKGSRDSLILMNDLALVVSIKNNTVITAVDGQNIQQNVFTNIDSAVIV